MRCDVFVRMALAALFGVSAAAQAQYAPYACNGTPGERMVGTTDSGGATVPLCVSGPAAAPAAPLVDYAGIAWHPDHDEVWFGGGWSEQGHADPEVLALCNQQTGGGCQVIGEYSNSYIAIVKAADGSLYYGWGQGEKTARKEARNNCMKARGAARQPLPCMELRSYSALTRRYIAPENLEASRKLYGVGAWLSGAEGYDNRAWFATGYRSFQDAIDAATGACRQAYAGKACETFAGTGNGVIQAYRQAQKSETAASDNAVAETTARRAADAAKALCSAAREKCTLQSQFDTRTSGVFLHDFSTGETTQVSPSR